MLEEEGVVEVVVGLYVCVFPWSSLPSLRCFCRPQQ